MKTILSVAKTELRTLFYSPIAWFIMIVFLVQCGIVYVRAIESVAKVQEMGGDLRWVTDLTAKMFLSENSLFPAVIRNLYLYIPLLTMGLISRETSSGTIKLLYSSPIKIREIVFGKFLGMVLFCLLLVGIVGIFILSGIFQIRFPDTGMLMTATLGFFLLLCAYSAIGLFMSCLTNYQVVAAVCTFLMIGLLYYVGGVWQDIDFVRELTYFLSVAGRTEKMLSGLLTTKDVVYFLVIVYIFLGLSIYKLKAGIESKPPVVKAARYLAVIISALGIGYISSRPALIGYYDATSTKSQTLTVNAQKVLEKLGDEPLEITAYSNLLTRNWDLGSFTSYNRNLARWEPYMRFKNDIILKTVRYYDTPFEEMYVLTAYPRKNMKEIAGIYAKYKDIKLTRILPPEEIHKVIDLKPELNRYVMQLKYKGKTTFLRIYNDPETWPSETEVSAALLHLIQEKAPKIAFLTGNLERDINKIGDRELKTLNNDRTFRNSLMNQGFDVDTVSVEEQEIPSDISTLVIADPKIEFDSKAMDRLKRYIGKGGNLLIAGEPGKQAILNPLLQQLGVQLMEGMVVQQSADFSPNFVTANPTDLACTFYKPLAKIWADSVKVTMPGAAGLSYNSGGPFHIQPLLVTDGKLTWNRKRELDLDNTISADATAIAGSSSTSEESASAVEEKRRKAIALGRVNFSAADGDARGPIPTVLGLTRKVNGKEQRIVVAGDADFMSNAELHRFTMRTSNFAFNTALFSWLSYGQFPIDSSRPEHKDKSVKLTTGQVDILRIIYIWVLPGLLLLFGTVLLIRRKRQ